MSSAWERQDGPSMPCVVCGRDADREIVLPRQPDVHQTFASNALCPDCAAAGAAGRTEELVERAVAGWSGLAFASGPHNVWGIAHDVVALVLAAYGMRADAPPIRTAPPPLTGSDAEVWRSLQPLMADGPAEPVSVRGRVEPSDGPPVDVWLAGDRFRVASTDGVPRLIGDGRTVWSFVDGRAVSSPYDRGTFSAGAAGFELAFRRNRNEVEAFGFGQPVGPLVSVEYLGRAAWSFAFGAPRHKPDDMDVVVDAETGLVLERRFASRPPSRWTEFVVGEPVDDALFGWDGPSVTRASLQAQLLREHEADMALRAAWFAEHVVALPLTVAGRELEVMPHDWSDDGAFEASLHGAFEASLHGGVDGSLARRVRSEEPWRLDWHSVEHRWSDARWDWALSLYDDVGPVDPAVVEELRTALARGGRR